MAATYYVQLLRSYRWEAIMAALDAAMRAARELLERERDSFPTDGVMVKTDSILANATLDDDEDEIIGSIYLGTVMNHVPSGRFYAPWSDVSDTVRDKDIAWWAALEKAAAKHGLTVGNGEGDPTDIFIYRYEPIEDLALVAALMPDDIGAK